MKALLTVDINDGTTKHLPLIRKGTVIKVCRVEDQRAALLCDYIGSCVVKKKEYHFDLHKGEFEAIQ